MADQHAARIARPSLARRHDAGDRAAVQRLRPAPLARAPATPLPSRADRSDPPRAREGARPSRAVLSSLGLRAQPYLFLAPALLATVLIVFVPVVQTAAMSFYNYIIY